MKITSKAEFFQLWEAGLLGNRPHLFRNPVEALCTDFPFYGFRELGKAGGGRWERVTFWNLPRTIERWKNEKRNFIIDSACYPANDYNITLEGEVCRTYRGWEGLLGYCKGYSMRAAAAAGLLKPRSGSEVLVLLDRWMDPSSQDDLRQLLDLYPEATVEFTCFDIDTGWIPGRNTIFWETRCY